MLRRWFAAFVASVLGVTVLLSAISGPERMGDRLQVILPTLALGCEIVNGNAAEYLLRFAVLEVGIHATKHGLGQTTIAERPNGKYLGMPSGHTAAAAFGASTLVHRCLAGAPPVRAAVVLGAAFTGASRIDSGNHTIWQVLAGAVWGLVCDRAFRRPGRGREGLRKALRRPMAAMARYVLARVVALRAAIRRRIRPAAEFNEAPPE